VINYLHITKDEERIVKLVKRKNKINCRLNLYGDKLIEYSGYMRDDLEKDKRINPQYVNLMKSFIDLFNIVRIGENRPYRYKIADGA
jgi:hypothetical protein